MRVRVKVTVILVLRVNDTANTRFCWAGLRYSYVHIYPNEYEYVQVQVF